MTTTSNKQARLSRPQVVGGGKSKWFYIGEDEMRAFRYYQVRDNQAGDTFFVADYRIAGISLKEHKQQRLHGATTRGEAWREAKSTLELLPLPAPPTEVTV